MLFFEDASPSSRPDPVDPVDLPFLLSGRRVSIDGDLEGSLRRDRAAADLGHAAEDRGVEIPRPAPVADADGHVFQDDEAPLVPQRLAIDSPLTYGAVTVFARKIIHIPETSLHFVNGYDQELIVLNKTNHHRGDKPTPFRAVEKPLNRAAEILTERETGEPADEANDSAQARGDRVAWSCLL